MYLWQSIAVEQLKQQIDAAVAAAVFDTDPVVVIYQAALSGTENDRLIMDRFNSLTLLGLRIEVLDGLELRQRISEVDHVICF